MAVMAMGYGWRAVGWSVGRVLRYGCGCGDGQVSGACQRHGGQARMTSARCVHGGQVQVAGARCACVNLGHQVSLGTNETSDML